MHITYETVKQSVEIRTYITQADASLLALGYTEHSFAHVTRCAVVAGDLLQELGYDAHTVELCRIAPSCTTSATWSTATTTPRPER